MLGDQGHRLAAGRPGPWLSGGLALTAVTVGVGLGVLAGRAFSTGHAAGRPLGAAAGPAPAAPAPLPVSREQTVTVTVRVHLRTLKPPAPTRRTPRPRRRPGGLPYVTLPPAVPTPAGARRVLRELQRLPSTSMRSFDY